MDVVSRGVDIVIATPGRMNDLEEAGLYLLNNSYML